METLVLQIGLKQGRSADIHKLEDREFYVGRAYSNDIVLTDPYVAPQQLRIYRLGIEADELNWNINVLDATNPVLINGVPLETATAAISPGDTITVGRTSIRVFSDEHVVEPARKLLVSGWLHQVSRAIAMPLAFFLAVCLVDSLMNYLLSNVDGDWEAHGLNTITGMAALASWAFLWAIVGRVLRHQPHFGQQLLITTFVAAIGLLQGPLETYTDFMFDNVELTELVGYGFATALLAYLLHYNLFLATNIKHTAAIAASVSISLSVMLFLFSKGEEEEFQSEPSFTSTLVAPIVNGRTGIALEDYLQSVDRSLQKAER